MFDKMFELAVVFSAVDHLTGPMNKMTKQLGIAQKQTAEMQKQMAKFKSMAFVGGAITGAGLVMADGLAKALEQAGQFQTKLTTIQDVTGATTKQMNLLANSIMDTSTQVSMFNDMQVAGFAQQLASGGFPKVGDVQKLLLPMAQFAEVQHYEGKASSPEESVNMAIGMAHMFKHYDTNSLSKFLDTFNKYSVMEPGSSQDMLQTLTYLAPVAFRQMHMKESDVMAMAALANRVGLNGSHGGTNAADMILRLIPGMIGGMPTATKTPAAWQAMRTLGLINAQGQSVFFKNGQITNFQGMLESLINAAKGRTPEEMARLYKEIFQVQGGRAASIFADKSTIEQLASMSKQLSVTKSMAQMQQDYLKTPEGQLNLLKSNSMTMMLRLAMQLGYVLNPILMKLNAILGVVMKFQERHPQMMKWVATFMSLATAAALVVGPLMLVVGALGYLRTANAVSNGFMLLRTSFMGMLGPVAMVAAAAYLLYEAWTHDWGGIREKTASVVSWVKKELPAVEAVIHRVAAALGFFNGKGKFQLPSWLPWVAGILVGIKALTGMIGVTTRVISSVSTVVGLFSRFGELPGLLLRLVGFIGRITGITRLWTAAQALLNIVMDANPIALIIIGVAALIGVIILLVTHWQTVIKWVKEVWNWYNHLGTGMKILIAIFFPLFVGIAALITHWKQVVTATQHVVTWVKEAWNWYQNLGDKVKWLIAIFAPFIGIPLLIVSKWKDIASFFDDLWIHHLKPIVDGIGWLMNHGAGLATNLWHDVFGGGNTQTPATVSPGGGSSYARLSPRAAGAGGNTTIHVHPGAIQVTAAPGRETQAGDAVYAAIGRQGAATVRSSGVRTNTVYK